MAKQTGEVLLVGTYGNITCYRMEGQYYARTKSSLTAKKFWKHKSFEGSRKSCNRFGEGNRLASQLYRMIEEEQRAYILFCFLKKRAIALLKEGKTLEEAENCLRVYLIEFGLIRLQEDECEMRRAQLMADLPAGECRRSPFVSDSCRIVKKLSLITTTNSISPPRRTQSGRIRRQEKNSVQACESSLQLAGARLQQFAGFNFAAPFIEPPRN